MMEDEREDKDSFVVNLLKRNHSEKIKNMHMPKSSRDAHLGFGRGGAENIHDWSRSPLSHIHDNLLSSPKRKKDLRSIDDAKIKTWGNYIDARLGTDSVEGLIAEIALESNLSRSQARQLVYAYMEENGYEEVKGEVLGRRIR